MEENSGKWKHIRDSLAKVNRKLHRERSNIEGAVLEGIDTLRVIHDLGQQAVVLYDTIKIDCEKKSRSKLKKNLPETTRKDLNRLQRNLVLTCTRVKTMWDTLCGWREVTIKLTNNKKLLNKVKNGSEEREKLNKVLRKLKTKYEHINAQVKMRDKTYNRIWELAIDLPEWIKSLKLIGQGLVELPKEADEKDESLKELYWQYTTRRDQNERLKSEIRVSLDKIKKTLKFGIPKPKIKKESDSQNSEKETIRKKLDEVHRHLWEECRNRENIINKGLWIVGTLQHLKEHANRLRNDLNADQIYERGSNPTWVRVKPSTDNSEEMIYNLNMTTQALNLIVHTLNCWVEENNSLKEEMEKLKNSKTRSKEKFKMKQAVDISIKWYNEIIKHNRKRKEISEDLRNLTNELLRWIKEMRKIKQTLEEFPHSTDKPYYITKDCLHDQVETMEKKINQSEEKEEVITQMLIKIQLKWKFRNCDEAKTFKD